MRIHELTIENFRGIKSFTHRFEDGLSAIIGAGDNGKTTILEAMALLFHPHWSLNLTDNDFYGGTPDEHPILISATIADPPTDLTHDHAFFEYLRGIDSETGEVVDEPDAHVPALTCELRVGSDFEPVWRVVCDRHSEGLAISARKRQKFGVRRIDASGHHLKWVPHSALHQLSDKPDGQSADTVLRSVSREARESARTKLSPFDDTIESITGEARLLRAASETAAISAELDADLTAISRGSISLHMEDRPVSRAGLGSRRLITVGVQNLAQAGARVLLIDELESGLEPHRTRHLIRYLQRVDGRQVLLTTHSSTVVRELDHSQLKIARRSTDGAVTLTTPPSEAQGALRTHADGFLAPRVLVCEGATEVGFIRGLCSHLEDQDPARMSLVAALDAGGDSKLVSPATTFKDLGYIVGVFCDYDRPKVDLSPLDGTGIALFRCDEGNAIEQQVLGNLTASGIEAVIQFAIEEVGRDVVLSSLDSSGVPHSVAMAFVDRDDVLNPEQYRDQIAIAAGKGSWFKQIGRGERLAAIVLDSNLTDMTPALEDFLDKLRDWCAPR